MKRKLSQQGEEDHEFDDFGSELERCPKKLTDGPWIKRGECCEISSMNEA